MSVEFNLNKYHSCLESSCPIRATGRVTNVVGLVVEARGPVSCLGTVCDIHIPGIINALLLKYPDLKIIKFC